MFEREIHYAYGTVRFFLKGHGNAIVLSFQLSRPTFSLLCYVHQMAASSAKQGEHLWRCSLFMPPMVMSANEGWKVRDLDVPESLGDCSKLPEEKIWAVLEEVYETCFQYAAPQEEGRYRRCLEVRRG